jgi:hypothetical protein
VIRFVLNDRTGCAADQPFGEGLRVSDTRRFPNSSANSSSETGTPASMEQPSEIAPALKLSALWPDDMQ